MKSAVVMASGIIAGCAAGLGGDVPATGHTAGDDWPYYNGNPAGTHYSQLQEINTSTVGRLKLAWTYDTRDKIGEANSTIESNPLVIDGRLFFISPNGRLISL